MTTIKNPAPAEFPTVTIATDSGTLTVPCEPINEWLAITPGTGTDDEGNSRLVGGFTITHVPTGMNTCEGFACINCCRGAGEKFAALHADWSSLTAENSIEWFAALSEQDRDTFGLYRGLEWGCDAELCEIPKSADPS
jgi:hypothetical protein